eukprot:Platyproteum_vivax@DN12577_c0_g1_i1.p1
MKVLYFAIFLLLGNALGIRLKNKGMDEEWDVATDYTAKAGEIESIINDPAKQNQEDLTKAMGDVKKAIREINKIMATTPDLDIGVKIQYEEMILPKFQERKASLEHCLILL